MRAAAFFAAGIGVVLDPKLLSMSCDIVETIVRRPLPAVKSYRALRQYRSAITEVN